MISRRELIVCVAILILAAGLFSIAIIRGSAHQSNIEDIQRAQSAFILDFRRLDDRWALANYYILTYVIDRRPYEVISRNRGRMIALINLLDPNWICELTK